MADYSESYDESSFWGKVREFAVVAGRKILTIAFTLYYCLQDPDTPVWAKAVIVAALGYFVSPIDAIPDVIPVVGYSDDLAVMLGAMTAVAANVKAEHRRKAREQVDGFLG